ncbi:MAG: exodeoxyribonuclease VII small subunit [Firmicutes bacterium]|nr:exodeoxyribonuclease VII small subunit [Bacillota bacterium]MDH7495078.1 exodeoxyribonuclease VII small subunit [Bacillota bacterium]
MSVDFEKAMGELEETVSRLESGDLTLEESLEAFEKGMSLVRMCRKKLDEAETRIAKLVETKGGELVTEPFRIEDEGG